MRNDKNDVSEEDSGNNMSPSLYARNQEVEVLEWGLLQPFENQVKTLATQLFFFNPEVAYVKRSEGE